MRINGGRGEGQDCTHAIEAPPMRSSLNYELQMLSSALNTLIISLRHVIARVGDLCMVGQLNTVQLVQTS